MCCGPYSGGIDSINFGMTPWACHFLVVIEATSSFILHLVQDNRYLLVQGLVSLIDFPTGAWHRGVTLLSNVNTHVRTLLRLISLMNLLHELHSRRHLFHRINGYDAQTVI